MKITTSIEKPFRPAKIEVLWEGIYWNTTFDFDIHITEYLNEPIIKISWENDNSIEYEKGYHIVENNTLTHDNKWVCAWDTEKWTLERFSHINLDNTLIFRRQD